MINSLESLEQEPKYCDLLSMLIVGLGICSSLLGPRIIDLSNVAPGMSLLSGGILPFCLSFMLLDIFTNQYGYDKAKRLTINYLICKTIIFTLLYIVIKIPAADGFYYNQSYVVVIHLMIRSFWASSLGTLAAFLLNCYLFSKLYISFRSKHLWLRCLVATSLGEFVFSIVSTPILFSGKLTTVNLFDLILHNYSFKIIFEIITLPLTYLIIHFISKYEVPYKIKYKNFTI